MMKSHSLLTAVCVVVASLFGIAAVESRAQTTRDDDFLPFVVTFVADRSLLELPEGVSGLEIESDECYGCQPNAAQWQLLGDSLRISKILKFNAARQFVYDDVTSESQLDGIKLHSQQLISAIAEIKPFFIGRRIPPARIGTTQLWDPVRQKWHTLADLSTFYEVVLRSDSERVEAREALEAVPGLKAVNYLPRRISDGFDCGTGYEPWLPNDPGMYLTTYGDPDTAWYMKSPETRLGGLNLPCAWSLLADGQRGNVTMAVIDAKADTNHPDLDVYNFCNNNFSLSGHTTGAVGCAAALGNNSIQVCGTAPDACVYAYNYAWEHGMPYDSALFYGHADALNIYMANQDGSEVIFFPNHWPKYDSLHFEVLRLVKQFRNVFVTAVGDRKPISYMNYPPPYMSYPGVWDSLCISVGMINGSGNIDSASNFQCDTCPPFVDVVAPGQGIRTTALGGDWDYFDGTSASCPVVAGIIALAKSIDTDTVFTPEALERMLEEEADRSGLNYPGDSAKYGAGRVDAYAFINAVKNTAIAMPLETAVVADSIPTLIITDDSLVSSFGALASYRTIRGSHTDIVSIQTVEQQYQNAGSDLAERVRACIKDYYDTKHLEWVILGGDSSIVPYRYAYTNLYGPGVRAISDYYYSCLDGDWNADSDTLWGEVNDGVDLVPEVAVGRLRLTYSTQVTNYTSKWIAYQSGPPSGWQDDVLAIGTQMFAPGDGPAIVGELLDLFPIGFGQTTLADTSGGGATATNFFSNMNQGQGILMYFGMAQHAANFFISRQTGASLLSVDDIDTLTNSGKAGLVYSVTCWNNKLDTVSIAAHYINHPTGGAVAYIGTSYNDYVFKTCPMAEDFWTGLFGDGSKQVGRLLNEAKECLLEKSTHYNGVNRHSMFGYMLAGDPQLDIWTSLPQQLDLSFADSIPIGWQSLTVSASDSGSNPVPGVTVCLMQDSTVYAVSQTDSLGEATFDSIQFLNLGTVTVAGSKHNYVSVVDSLPVVGCCVGDMGNVNCDPYNTVDITDLQVLIDHLFLSLAPLCCEEEADLDYSGTVDVTDLNILNDHMFGSLTPLDACP